MRGELLISRASFAELKERAKANHSEAVSESNRNRSNPYCQKSDNMSEPIDAKKVLASELNTSTDTANKIIQINKLADAEAKEKFARLRNNGV